MPRGRDGCRVFIKLTAGDAAFAHVEAGQPIRIGDLASLAVSEGEVPLDEHRGAGVAVGAGIEGKRLKFGEQHGAQPDIAFAPDVFVPRPGNRRLQVGGIGRTGDPDEAWVGIIAERSLVVCRIGRRQERPDDFCGLRSFLLLLKHRCLSFAQRSEGGSRPALSNDAIQDTLLPVMATLDVAELSAFVAVVRAGSFTRAALALGTQKAHLSRVVSRLEDRLRVQLLQRSTRALAVTEAGRELFERAVGVLAALEETEGAIQKVHSEPGGTLRLTCGVEFGLLVVNKWIASYLRLHSGVRVEADFTNRLVDIVHEGVDVAIRVGPPTDSSLSARKLGEVGYSLYASPEYLRRRPAPAEPLALAEHDLIAFTPRSPPSSQAGWLLVSGAKRTEVPITSARLLVNNNLAARDAAAEGLGITLLPRFQAAAHADRGELVPVMPSWERPPVPVHAVFASSRYMASKVRTFVDHARSAFLKGTMTA